jgi:hypothetical protein
MCFNTRNTIDRRGAGAVLEAQRMETPVVWPLRALSKHRRAAGWAPYVGSCRDWMRLAGFHWAPPYGPIVLWDVVGICGLFVKISVSFCGVYGSVQWQGRFGMIWIDLAKWLNSARV